VKNTKHTIENATTRQRNFHLDGLRGLAALVVMLYHYLLSFYPAIFTLQARDSHTAGNIEAWIGTSPLSFMFNGNFAVCLFFVLSGYVLSLRFFSEGDLSSPGVSAIKRYFRMAIPIICSVLISYIILKFHGYGNSGTGNITLNNFWFSKLWNVDPNISGMLGEGFIDALLNGNTVYNPVLWTMNIEFKGSLLVFCILALCGKMKNRWIIYLVLGLVFCKSYLLAFVLGMGLCDYRYSRYYKAPSLYITVPALVLALYMAGFELISVKPASSWGFLDRTFAEQNQIYYIIGATLMLGVFIHEKRFQSALSGRVLTFLGKISFSLYLLHLILLGSFTCFVFNMLYVQNGLTYHSSVLIAFLLSFSVLIAASYYYYKYIDSMAIGMAEKIYQNTFRRKAEKTEPAMDLPVEPESVDIK
jgi:peptidoglycan/LPS O-acetylase OafA/YrhL